MSDDYPSGPVVDLETALGPVRVHVNSDNRVRIESGIPLNVEIGERGGPVGALAFRGKTYSAQHDLYRDDDGTWHDGWKKGDPSGSLRIAKCNERNGAFGKDATPAAARKITEAIREAVNAWAHTEQGAATLVQGEQAERQRDRYTIRQQLAEHEKHVEAYRKKLFGLDTGLSRDEYGGPYAEDERGKAF